MKEGGSCLKKLYHEIVRDWRRVDRFGPIQLGHPFSRHRKSLRSVQWIVYKVNNKENENNIFSLPRITWNNIFSLPRITWNNIFCLPRITFSRIMETQLSLRNKILVNEKAIIRLLTVRAHMLTNIDKHLTCNTGRGKTTRKWRGGGDGGNHYCFVRGRKLGRLGGNGNDSN